MFRCKLLVIRQLFFVAGWTTQAPCPATDHVPSCEICIQYKQIKICSQS